MTARFDCPACGTDVPVTSGETRCPECGTTYPTEGLGASTAPERTSKAEHVDAEPSEGWPMVVELPWEPCGVPVNDRMTLNRGQIHTTSRWKRGLNHARMLVMAHAPTGEPDAETRFRAGIALYRPDNRRRDVDGMAKLALDALEGSVLADDAQVRELYVRDAGVDREEPRIVVTVAPLADGEAA